MRARGRKEQECSENVIFKEFIQFLGSNTEEIEQQLLQEAAGFPFNHNHMTFNESLGVG